MLLLARAQARMQIHISVSFCVMQTPFLSQVQ